MDTSEPFGMAICLLIDGKLGLPASLERKMPLREMTSPEMSSNVISSIFIELMVFRNVNPDRVELSTNRPSFLPVLNW